MKRAALLLAAALCLAAPATAQIQPAAPAAAGHWRALTELDLEAAYALVRDNHPAAAPELGDDQFRADLERAIGLARSRAAKVDSYAGYAAVLNGFATALGDKHIWSRQAVRPAIYLWPGLAMARRGADWRVAVDARGDQAGGSLQDAKLISCDGRAADAIAEERLGGFRAVWSVEAQRVQTAPWLLVDDGNPFLTRPRACVFETGGARRELTLTWTRIGPVTLTGHVNKAINTGAAGFGLRPFAGGFWISIQGLDDRARPVVDQVIARSAELREAPMVVLDLRGNGGGASSFGDEIATALMGDAYLRRAMGSAGEDCPDLWRATPGNYQGLKTFLDENGAALDADSRRFWQASLQRLEAAVKAGQTFDGPVRACPGADAPEPAPLDGRGSLLKGRMVILTDADCFSSCLLVTQRFRRLGALHVGGTTDAGTRYMEVREAILPSGLSYASTLQKVALSAPRQIGPFAPSRQWDGAMADTAGLEAWIAAMR